MYHISDTQIDFILNDISARGVEMESLQQNLLDHICCIIENKLEDNGDFEAFYRQTITTFYKEHLWEIEEETIRLLIFKNYYTMKKTMIYSGAATTALLLFGIFFKFMHWPGASAMLVLGIFIACFVFLPLAFTLRIKEKQNTRDKVVIGIGIFSSILLSLHVLFKVQHWPFANVLGIISLIILMALFLPAYFFSGIRQEETKINTIISSVLMVIGCGLILILMRSPYNVRSQNIRYTAHFLRNEYLIDGMLKKAIAMNDTSAALSMAQQKQSAIFTVCKSLKQDILEGVCGVSQFDASFESKEDLITDGSIKDVFENNARVEEKLKQLAQLMDEYQSFRKDAALPIDSKKILDLKDDRANNALATLSQIQMMLLQK